MDIKQFVNSIITGVKRFIREKLKLKNAELPYYITIVLALVFFTITLSLFIQIADSLAEDDLEPYDSTVAQYIISLRTPPLTGFFSFVTDLGDRVTYVIISVALVAFFWFRYHNWKFSLQLIGVLILSSLSNIALKRVLNRSRPEIEHLVEVNTLSFPSGHSMSAMAFYGFLIYLCYKVKMPRRFRAFLVTCLVLLILLIGVSRIYLGVHFPSDVAAGFLGGLIWVTLSVFIFNIIDLLRKRKTGAEETDEPLRDGD